MISNGATLKVAAAANGISNDSLLRWRKDNPDFAAQCQAARHGALASYQGAIHNQTNRDWKAAKFMLETAPETREDYRTDRNSRLEVVINIDRDRALIDGSTIEGVAAEVESDVPPQ